MIRLTDPQKKMLLQLGRPAEGSTPHLVEAEIHQQLVQLGLVHMLKDGTFDLTERGGRLYDLLA